MNRYRIAIEQCYETVSSLKNASGKGIDTYATGLNLFEPRETQSVAYSFETLILREFAQTV